MSATCPSESKVEPVPVRTFEDSTHRIWCVAWYPDGKRIVTGTENGDLRIWDTDTGLQVVKADTVKYDPLEEMDIPPGEEGDEGLISVARAWQAWNGEGDWDGGNVVDPVSVVDVNPSGKTIASGSVRGRIGLWDAETGELLRTWRDQMDTICDVHFSPDGKGVGSASLDCTVQISKYSIGGKWESRQITCSDQSDYYGSPTRAVRYSPDSQRIAFGGEGSCQIRNVSDLKHAILKLPIESGECVNSLAWTHDGKQLIASHTDKVTVYNASSGEKIRIYTFSPEKERYPYFGAMVSLSPTTTHLAVVGSDDYSSQKYQVFVLDLDTWEKVVEYKYDGAVTRVAYSPSGSSIATICDYKVFLWEAPRAQHSSSSSSILDLPVTVSPGATRISDQVVEGLPHGPLLDPVARLQPPPSVQPSDATETTHKRTLRQIIGRIFHRRDNQTNTDGPTLVSEADLPPRSRLPFSFILPRNPFAGASRRRNASPVENGGHQEESTPEGDQVAEARTRPIYALYTGPLADEVERGCFFHLASYACYGRRDPNVSVPSYKGPPTSAPGVPLSTLGTVPAHGSGGSSNNNNSHAHQYPPAQATTCTSAAPAPSSTSQAQVQAQTNTSPLRSRSRTRALFDYLLTFPRWGIPRLLGRDKVKFPSGPRATTPGVAI